MNRKTAIVFGGSSGIGEATARAFLKSGVGVTIVGRDEAKLHAAAVRLREADAAEANARESDTGELQIAVADAADRAAVTRVFEVSGKVDDVVICVSGGKGAGAFRDLNLDDVRAALEAKTMAQLLVAQVAASYVRDGGSITFVTAASPRSVIRGTVGLAVVNGALEAMIPILALELAPIRVNAVSPGIVDTPWWDGMPQASKDAFFAAAAAILPVRRVGNTAEVAALIALVANSGFVTGSVYEIDGGSHLVTQ